MEPPFAHVLHVERVRSLATSHAYERGERYFQERRVVAIQQRDGALHATVRGSSDYQVRIWASASGLAYRCSCPVGDEGGFCKHCVAAAFAWLSGRAVSRS